MQARAHPTKRRIGERITNRTGTSLDRCGPFATAQDYLWGGDCFFYGDCATMESMCCLVHHYDEYARKLGYASSEPMMEAHIKREGFELLPFPRCFSVDRR